MCLRKPPLKMHLQCVALISVIVCVTRASWINDLTSPKGLSFGDGVTLKLEDTKAKNSSVVERLALRVDNENVGISMAQNAEKKAVELDFYTKDKVEGRGRKVGNMILPFVLGATGAGFMTVAAGGVKLLVVKAIMVAKLALIISLILILGKMAKEAHHEPRHVEIDHHAASEPYPVYAEYPHSDASNYSPSASGGGGYTPYSYGPSGSETVMSYATVEAPGGNGSVPVTQQVVPVAKRRDYRKKSRPMVLTITHITQPEKGGLL